MKTILAIVKKELKIVFTNKRMVAALLFPGILIYLLYTLMGTFMFPDFNLSTEDTHTIYVCNQHEELSTYYTDQALIYGYKVEAIEIEESQLEEYKNKVANLEVNLLIVYNDAFNDNLNDIPSNQAHVSIYYNSDSDISYVLSDFAATVINKLNNSDFYINNQSENYDLTTSEFNMLAMMLPMIILSFVISSVLSSATEAIAGEKERGTMASLLITPVSRYHLAAGKILAITIPALISGTVTFLGLLLSLHNIDMFAENMTVMSATEFISLFFIIIVTALVFTGLISLISTYAKTIKEAQQFATPLLLIVMVVSMGSEFLPDSSVVYLIPILNSTAAITSCLEGTFGILDIVFFITSNLLLVITTIFFTAKMFNSEKIIFSK